MTSFLGAGGPLREAARSLPTPALVGAPARVIKKTESRLVGVKMRHRAARCVNRVLFVLAAGGVSLLPSLAGALAGGANAGTERAKKCDAGAQEQLQDPARLKEPLSYSCRVTFVAKAGAKIRPFVLTGEDASGSIIDCAGQEIDSPSFGLHPSVPNVAVASKQRPDKSWSVPRNIELRNCRFMGQVTVVGMGLSASGPIAKESSLQVGHTARAQSAAPESIRIIGSEFVTAGRTPIYIGPGVTGFTLKSSKIIGKTAASAIYLEAESKEAVIQNNEFMVSSSSREIIAVDGSASNLISNNTFHDASRGGVFIYRNCGEGGAIRHQTPSDNRILFNKFLFPGEAAAPAVWVNSRMGRSKFCSIDPSHPFGSSLNPLDGGERNLVRGNIAEHGGAECVRGADAKNEFENNVCR